MGAERLTSQCTATKAFASNHDVSLAPLRSSCWAKDPWRVHLLKWACSALQQKAPSRLQAAGFGKSQWPAGKAPGSWPECPCRCLAQPVLASQEVSAEHVGSEPASELLAGAEDGSEPAAEPAAEPPQDPFPEEVMRELVAKPVEALNIREARKVKAYKRHLNGKAQAERKAAVLLKSKKAREVERKEKAQSSTAFVRQGQQQWYEITVGNADRTLPELEKYLKAKLHDLDFELFYPTFPEKELTKSGNIKKKRRKLFTNTVFFKVELSPDVYDAIQDAPSCYGWSGGLRSDGGGRGAITMPWPTQQNVDALKAQVKAEDDHMARLAAEFKQRSEQQPAKRAATATLKGGVEVEVVEGPFEGQVGTVREVWLEEDKVRVILPLFGMDTPTDLALSQIRVLPKSKKSSGGKAGSRSAKGNTDASEGGGSGERRAPQRKTGSSGRTPFWDDEWMDDAEEFEKE